jgi:hypothetical protein
MSKEQLPWDDDALERLQKIPAFVRTMAKGKIEKAAIAAGEARVSAAFMDANRAKLMG